jgi:hypothetical protein
MLNNGSLCFSLALDDILDELVRISRNKMDDVLEVERNESDGWWWWLAKDDLE